MPHRQNTLWYTDIKSLHGYKTTTEHHFSCRGLIPPVNIFQANISTATLCVWHGFLRELDGWTSICSFVSIVCRCVVLLWVLVAMLCARLPGQNIDLILQGCSHVLLQFTYCYDNDPGGSQWVIFSRCSSEKPKGLLSVTWWTFNPNKNNNHSVGRAWNTHVWQRIWLVHWWPL